MVERNIKRTPITLEFVNCSGNYLFLLLLLTPTSFIRNISAHFSDNRFISYDAFFTWNNLAVSDMDTLGQQHRSQSLWERLSICSCSFYLFRDGSKVFVNKFFSTRAELFLSTSLFLPACLSKCVEARRKLTH